VIGTKAQKSSYRSVKHDLSCCHSAPILLCSGQALMRNPFIAIWIPAFAGMTKHQSTFDIALPARRFAWRELGGNDLRKQD